MKRLVVMMALVGAHVMSTASAGVPIIPIPSASAKGVAGAAGVIERYQREAERRVRASSSSVEKAERRVVRRKKAVSVAPTAKVEGAAPAERRMKRSRAMRVAKATKVQTVAKVQSKVKVGSSAKPAAKIIGSGSKSRPKPSRRRR